MRVTYDSFTEAIFNNKHGLFFPGEHFFSCHNACRCCSPLLLGIFADMAAWLIHLFCFDFVSHAEYGPGDQSAINQFYEASAKTSKLTQAFNTNPYHTFLEIAYVVHLHGPNSSDQLILPQNGTCTLETCAKHGLIHSLCTYVLEWAKHVQDEEIGQDASESDKRCGSGDNSGRPCNGQWTNHLNYLASCLCFAGACFASSGFAIDWALWILYIDGCICSHEYWSAVAIDSTCNLCRYTQQLFPVRLFSRVYALLHVSLVHSWQQHLLAIVAGCVAKVCCWWHS